MSRFPRTVGEELLEPTRLYVRRVNTTTCS
jgi:hypothetical protein